ncbi:MAG: ribonuclease HII, partial [Candidatus Korarchaeota archaeon]|nr:ribonuclease HII [Candidatus Korarchaeota archaeon]
DVNYPVVSAASILAKVHRDRIIERLRDEYGDFGSGYAGDERTIRFLREWVRERGSLPPIARRSWLTASRILTEERAGLKRYF